MTAVVLAHHAIIAALPFVLPAVLITASMVGLAIRDRRRDDSPGEGGE